MALVNFYTQITNDSRTVYMYIALISSVDLPQKAVPIPVPVNFIGHRSWRREDGSQKYVVEETLIEISQTFCLLCAYGIAA